MAGREHLATHPDENVLAAFAEHSLALCERQSVLEHLSTCVRCRDVVFLAQQAFSETDQSAITAQPPVLRQRWGLSWGILGAAGVLAALLVSFPIAMYRHRSRPAQQAALPAPAVRQATAPPARAPLAAPEAIEAPPAVTHPHPTQKSSGYPSTSRAKGNGEIAGSVADASGAAVRGASVSVRALPNGTAHTAATDAKGQFNVASLPSGNYQVEVQAPGFNHFTDSVTVQPSEQTSLVAKLAPGAATQTVTVTPAPTAQPATPEVNVGVIGGLVSDNRSSLPARNAKPPASAPASGAAPAAQAAPKPAQPIEQGQITNGAMALAVPVDRLELPPTFSVKDGLVLSCIGDQCVKRLLPGGAKAVSAAGEWQTAIAIDSDGNLFLSSDKGEHWQRAKVQWSGKAVSVGFQPMHVFGFIGKVTAAPIQGAAATENKASVAVPTFELTNDKGQVWVSLDGGERWVARRSTQPAAPSPPPP